MEKQSAERLAGREIRQGNRFEYLGGTVTRDGKFEAEVWRRIQVAANAWRRVEGVMVDRKISRELKGKVMVTCVTLAFLYGFEIVTLTERQQQQKLQV